ncbi:MAG: DUF2461 domain-containing protein [Cytophagales bacterium]|nr:MAG: DUF2461 domain-containing protein [Cytophagales bacterium]
MLQSFLIDFLAELKANNNREWFADNKAKYTQAKENFEAFITQLIPQLWALDDTFVHIKTQDTLFRIYRDVRFSPNKDPYKTQFSAYFCKGGKNSQLAGYYLHIEPSNSFVGGGAYMPAADLLKKIRQEIDYNGEEFLQIIENKEFKNRFGEIEGEKLKTLPKGYTADNPTINFLKMKGFVATCKFSDEQVLSENFDKQIATSFFTMQPLIDFLNRAMKE